ncbi:DUF3291 domain-containing protein [Hellea balneolensis]|uniref:DUF3291 domain-containing protein n=1 Tax=Hellea balneolensis TaxID=287478 RepID=UPI0003F5E149|nr:DUF3291 domain-containing protein [Hellea balneolensis]
MQLAQLNIAEAKYGTEDARMDGFTGRVDIINAMADRSPGFIWRLTDDDETDGALSLRMEGQNDYTLVNMSVWADIESLFHFIYKTAHAKVMQGKNDWFNPMSRNHMVLWWVEDGHIPSMDEAKTKLDAIRAHGPSPEAFDFQTPFSDSGAPVKTNFPKKDCA